MSLAIRVSSWARSLPVLLIVWAGGASRWSLCLGGPVDWALFSSGSFGWDPWLGGAAGFFPQSVGTLAGFCNHFWLGRFVGYVLWQGGATDCVPQLGRAESHDPQSLLGGWGLRVYSLTGWFHWLDLMFRQGCWLGFMVRCSLRLCSKIGPDSGWAL